MDVRHDCGYALCDKTVGCEEELWLGGDRVRKGRRSSTCRRVKKMQKKGGGGRRGMREWDGEGEKGSVAKGAMRGWPPDDF